VLFCFGLLTTSIPVLLQVSLVKVQQWARLIKK